MIARVLANLALDTDLRKPIIDGGLLDYFISRVCNCKASVLGQMCKCEEVSNSKQCNSVMPSMVVNEYTFYGKKRLGDNGRRSMHLWICFLHFIEQQDNLF